MAARPWRREDPPARVLAIRLHALGDTVLTLPYLHAVRRLLGPDVTLDFLTREEVADIPRSVVLFDRVYAIGGGRNSRAQALSAAALLPRLWLSRYQVVLDLQRSRLSRAVRMALAPGAWSEFDRFSPRLAGERTRATIEAAGLGPLDVRADLELRRPDDGLDRLREAGWDGASALVVLNPATAFPGRRWPLESWARFAELWSGEPSSPAQFVVMGLPSLAEAARFLKERLGDRLVDLVGRTGAGQAFALLHRATLVVSADSGLMHMAWVAGAPTLALFGASRDVWARPHGTAADYVGACRRPDGTCMDGVCRAAPPSCLEEVTPEAVVARGRALLRALSQEEGVPRIRSDGQAHAPPLARGGG